MKPILLILCTLYLTLGSLIAFDKTPDYVITTYLCETNSIQVWRPVFSQDITQLPKTRVEFKSGVPIFKMQPVRLDIKAQLLPVNKHFSKKSGDLLPVELYVEFNPEVDRIHYRIYRLENSHFRLVYGGTFQLQVGQGSAVRNIKFAPHVKRDICFLVQEPDFSVSKNDR